MPRVLMFVQGGCSRHYRLDCKRRRVTLPLVQLESSCGFTHAAHRRPHRSSLNLPLPPAVRSGGWGRGVLDF